MYGLVDPYSDAGRIHELDVFSFLLTFASSALALVQTQVLPSDPPYSLTLYLWTPLMLIWLLSGLAEGYLHVEMSQYAGFSWITYAAYLKALSTLMKYSMQIWHNYVKKSVMGVSHQACWIDFGATCSAWAQMQVDSWNAGFGLFLFDPRVNFAKLLLASIAGVSDLFILAQYYFIYPSQVSEDRDTDFKITK